MTQCITNTHARTHARTHAHTHIHARTHARKHTSLVARDNTRARARTHTHIHTTHTHTPSCIPPVNTASRGGETESLWGRSYGRWGFVLSAEPSEVGSVSTWLALLCCSGVALAAAASERRQCRGIRRYKNLHQAPSPPCMSASGPQAYRFLTFKPY